MLFNRLRPFAFSLLIALVLLPSCLRDEEVYSHSVVVPTSPWTAADTLFFPLRVNEEPDVEHRIRTDSVYSLFLGLRYTSRFAFSALGFGFGLQRLDAAGHPDSLLFARPRCFCPVRDGSGACLGDTWGSLIQLRVPDRIGEVRFPAPADYRFYLVPLPSDTLPLCGVHSVTFTLR